MDKICSERKKLKNGLCLLISFQSIHTAGDRCQVIFEALIDVKIEKAYFDDELLSDLNPQNVIRLLGNETSYHYTKIRNFIAEDEKNNIFEELKKEFLESSLSYLSSPLFPVKLIKRNYMTAEKEEMNRIKREAYLNS